jgi:UPF0716 family protein affecting phage T7 exclusion
MAIVSRFAVVWLAAYVLLIGAVVGGMLFGRQQALAVYGSQAAQAEWDAWREDARRLAEESGPVKRRVPKSPAPPALVLMRDHFGVCLMLALVLSTVLFGTFMLLVRGATASRRVHERREMHRPRRPTS